MRPLHQRWLRRLGLLLGALAWLSAQSLALVHQIMVQHVRCAEHGDVMEVSEPADESGPSDQEVAQADDHDEQHDHDCSLDGLATAALQPDLVLAPSWDPPMDEVIRAFSAGGARAPPLSYAPKTSPPTC